MAEEKSTPTAQSEANRQRSTIEFPYLDLDDAVEIAKTIHTVFGASCQREQLAAQLQQAAGGGGFNLRLGTAKMFGFIAYERGMISLTDLGLRVADSQQEKPARIEAFLKIELYKSLFEKYRGKALPPAPNGLEAEMVTMGVAPKQKDKARQVFQRSAKQAGFFWSGNDRLVLPAQGKYIATMTGAAEKTIREEKTPEREREKQHTYPHFIQGLLSSLPKEGEEWSRQERKNWLQLAAMSFELMYKDKDSKGSIKVEVEDGQL